MFSLLQFWSTITVVGGIVMNGVLAAYVYNDARWLSETEPRRLKVLSPAAWAVVVFFGSLLAFGLYLAVHHTTLARTEPKNPTF